VSTLLNDKPGVVLADQVKNLDWRARRAKKAGAVEPLVLDEVLAKLEALLW
jgi:mRNA interferase MazF